MNKRTNETFNLLMPTNLDAHIFEVIDLKDSIHKATLL